MDIKFNDNKLRKYANSDSLANRKLGKIKAKLYKARLDDLFAAESFEELRYVPGNYHELTKNRKGQWACDLDQPYRLILFHKRILYLLIKTGNIYGRILKELK